MPRGSWPKLPRKKIILCPACDLALEGPPLKPGQKLVCPRCGETLRTCVSNPLEKGFVLSLTGLLLFFPAVCKPLLTFGMAGYTLSGSVLDSAVKMIGAGYIFAGGMVLLTAVVIPFMKFFLLLVLCWQIYQKKAGLGTAALFRFYLHLDEWGMLEVYMIGILVTIIKMMHLVHIQYNLGFFCFIGLLLLSLVSSLWLDKHALWERIEAYRAPDPLTQEKGISLEGEIYEGPYR